MSDVANDGRAVLRAALVAIDATVKAATDARTALKAALGDGEVEDEVFDPEDREGWLTLKQAAGVARRSERTIERWLPRIGIKFGGRWYISRRKLLAYRGS